MWGLWNSHHRSCYDIVLVQVVQRFQQLLKKKKYKEAADLAAENLEDFFQVEQRFEHLLAQKKYMKATELAAENLENFFQLENSLLDKAKLECQLAETKTLLEITTKQLTDINRKERCDALKNVEESSRHVIEFSLSELEKATNNFDMSLKIREEENAILYEGFLEHTIVAIKIFKPESSEEEDEFNQEVEILIKLRHPNVISLVGVSREAHALVYEFLPNGNLETFLTGSNKSSQTLSWQNRIRIACEICSALIFLHSVMPDGIVHGDLKPQIVLLDSNFVCKLSEFDIPHKLPQTNERITKYPKITPVYCAPEFFSSFELTPQCDIYSFGIILLQLLTGRDPLRINYFVKEALATNKLYKIVEDSAGKWPMAETEKLASLALRCCHPIKNQRPDLGNEVLPFIESMKQTASFH